MRQRPIGRPARGARGGAAFLDVLAAAALSLFASLWALQRLSGVAGVATVADEEVAVVFDETGGAGRVVERPGNLLFVPFIEQVRLLSRSPEQITMEGEGGSDTERVSRLLLRANDGSRFGLDSFSIQYALVPERAREALADTGDDPRARARLVESWARSVLRDQFGLYPTEEISKQETLRQASEACKALLNRELSPHGIEVLELSTIRPKFDPAYEEAVERRQVAQQEIERLKRKLVQLEAEHGERVARRRKDKVVELKVLEDQIGKELDAAQRETVNRRHAADLYAAGRIQAGELERLALVQKARGLMVRYQAEAEGLEQQMLALEERGEAAVREALIENLAQVEFELVPYALDPAPDAVRVVEQTLVKKD
ncbi:MAG: SPFH domain-containing protein [Planctomycetota bacterium]|jgi:hypothetical protein|nr:SPFH domain-containing protein [Planctomycetota bacterium]MDP6763944.1 SPFH domain-containing protein [Planctomycetota bacterium]MDP6990530.1 SPFH domain-containing protein [Planctomycetota bacterium]